MIAHNKPEVKKYIDEILEDGFNLNETTLEDYPEFADVQDSLKWSDMIEECVRKSSFGTKFNITCLKHTRLHIAKSTTLSALRQSVTAMIEPLQLWRDHVHLQTYFKKKLADKKIGAAYD